MTRRYFGTDGVRGRVGKAPITPDFVLRLGQAAGRVLRRQSLTGHATVLIGKDTRVSGYMLEAALQAGFSSAGVDIVLCGPIPTPAVAYLTRALRLDAGVVISASHNPYDDNGIKFFARGGFKLPDQKEDDIEAVLGQDWDRPTGAGVGRVSHDQTTATNLYIDHLVATIAPLNDDKTQPKPPKGLKIVADCANGATSVVAPEALRRADRVLLTLGTAWVYEHNGQVVANCHRQPATEFVRRRLGVAEITGAFSALLAGPLAGKEVILTVSPVRHLGDGLEGNAVSKATLRLAAEELAAAHAAVHYFPAYEVLNDDLRDYRFYADDLVHPSPQAIQYVWEKFIPAVLSDEARRLLPDVRHIVVAAAHRPRNPRCEAYREFCRRRIEEIAALPQVDFQAEEEYFRRCIEINS